MAKVLFISYNGMLEHLSQSQIIPYLAGLSERGFTITLLSYEKASDYRDKKALLSHRAYFNDKGIEWRHLAYHKNPGLAAKIFDITQGIVYSFYLVLSRKADIIHARSTIPAAIAFSVSKVLGIKFVFDVRGLLAQEYADGNLWRRGSSKYRLVNYFEKKLLSAADAIVVLTNKIGNIFAKSGYFKGAGNVNISVIPCCVDLHKFKYLPNKDYSLLQNFNLRGKFIFLYSGSLGTWYMLEEMLDFFLEAQKSIPQAHFLILTQSEKGFARRIISAKRLDGNITITTAPSSAMPGIVSLADAGLFFIKPSFSKLASSPTKLGEFLACGVPVVINSGVGDTEEMVNSYRVGVVVNDFNISSYRAAVQEFLVLLKEKEALRCRCRLLAESALSLKQGVDKYCSIYNSLN